MGSDVDSRYHSRDPFGTVGAGGNRDWSWFFILLAIMAGVLVLTLFIQLFSLVFSLFRGIRSTYRPPKTKKRKRK